MDRRLKNDWAGLTREKFLMALTDCRTDLRIADFPFILEFIGREFRGDGDHSAGDGELKLVSGFDSRLAADALRHRDFSLRFEG
jgi:hypothetical protein